MEVVLRKDFERLGKAMDVINVKDGYARNYLIPQGIAVPASESNKKQVAEAKRIAEKREEQKKLDAAALAKKIENVPITVHARVSDGEKIFGSVGAQEISEYLRKEGFEVERSAVELEEAIKQLGVYNITIRLHRDITATVKVWIVKEES